MANGRQTSKIESRLADRVLVDGTPTAMEAGFRFPVAARAALMAAVETIPQQYSHEDIKGRLWDLLWMASLAARRAKPGFLTDRL